MQFVYPNFLWALTLLAIPIIIHLFYFRRFKKVYFTNVRFLKEVKEETNSRNKLKNLLILLSRLLAMALLIFAFAQPFIPSSDQKVQGRKGVSIYVDNSFSMNALSDDVSLLNKAKQKAQEIITAYGEDERFQIISNDFSAAQQRILTKEEAMNALDEINERPEVYELSQVLNRQRQALNQDNFDTKIFYQISDFQRNIADELIPVDSTEQINLVALQSIQDINVSIDSCYFLSKVPMINQANQLVVKLTNHSDEDRSGIRLSLLYENETRPLGLKEIPANTSIIDTVSINISTPGWNTAEISIIDYPITFDDKYKIAFEVKEQIKVLTINEDNQNRYLDALFNSLNIIDSENESVNRVSYSDFSSYELIILNDITSVTSGLGSAIKNYAQEGGNVLIFPNRNADITQINTFLSQLGLNTLDPFQENERIVGTINLEEFIFQDVYAERYNNIKLPKVTGSFNIKNFQSVGEESLLSYRDGNTYLGKYTIGNGHIYLCSAPLNTDYNDLVQNAEIFVPMIFKMAVSTGSSKPIAYTIGKNRILETDNIKDNVDIVYRFKGPQEFIPSQTSIGGKVILNVEDNITESGIYDIVLNEQLLAKAAFNFDKLESDLDYLNSAELNEKYGAQTNIFSTSQDINFAQLIAEKSLGISYYKWCIILALIFLAIEQLLLRFWKS